MWPKMVLLVLKSFGYVVNFLHARKQVRVEDFGAVGAVKTLDVAILCWLTRLNKLQLDLFVFGPKLHGWLVYSGPLYMRMRLSFP